MLSNPIIKQRIIHWHGSNEKGGQKEGDVLERSVEEQHDFDSMKGSFIKIANPKDVRLSKRRRWG